MTAQKLKNLIATKLQLADKYDWLSKVACGEPKRLKFRRRAAEYRHQTKMLEIKSSRR